jgi:hypothetical protein
MSVSNQDCPLFRMAVRPVFSLSSENRNIHAFAPQVGELNKRHGERYKSLCGKWFCVGSTFGNDDDIDVTIEGFRKCASCVSLMPKLEIDEMGIV